MKANGTAVAEPSSFVAVTIRGKFLVNNDKVKQARIASVMVWLRSFGDRT